MGPPRGRGPSYLALGLGVKFLGIHLDVSYLTASKALGNSVTIGKKRGEKESTSS